MLKPRPNSHMKTGTAPAAPQDFRLPEDVFEEIFHNYLSSPLWDTSERGPSRSACGREWGKRQGELSDLSRLSKITKVSILVLAIQSKRSILTKCSQPTIEKVLYSSPYIPSLDRLCSFATSVLKGDSRWDSLKRNPYSTPGRYVHVLDLSRLDEARGAHRPNTDEGASPSTGLDSTAGDGLRLNGCLNTLFPLLPHLEVLILPSSIPVAPSTLRALRSAPCRHQLKVLHGLVITQAIEPNASYGWTPPADNGVAPPSDVDSMLLFLRAFPKLKDISIKGYGENDPGLSTLQHPQPALELVHLETLALHGVKSGLLIESLCQGADEHGGDCLPALRHLDLASYANLPGDRTVDFLRIHGRKLRTLTLRPPTDWPPLRVVPPSEVLVFCPRLEVLRYMDPNTLPPEETFEDPAFSFTGSQHQSLRHLSITKWSTAPAFRDGPHPPSTGQFERLFHKLLHNLPPNLEDVTVENFAWLRKPLGKAGMSAGVNGLCRRLSGALALRGVRLLDKDGTEMPDVSGIGGMGSFGMTSMMRGLQGAAGSNIRLGMRGVGERRRPSMDAELDDESG
jgi:hypothetical protein